MRKLLQFALYLSGFTVLFGALALSLCAYQYFQWLDRPLNLDERPFILNVPENSNLTQVVYELGVSGYLAWPRLLLLHARWADQQQIRAGEFRLVQGDTPRTLLNKLNLGEVVTYRITLPEGRTTAQMLELLRGDTRLEDDLKGATAAQLPQVLNLDIAHTEGWFYPDTYVFARGTPMSRILLQAHRRMQETLEREWQARAVGTPYQNPYEALIMASIVERETGLASERAEIAGVFVRRLQMGMRLQTDPTIIYGLGDEFRGNLTREHLRRETPYNTYVIRGLPPTPIANPGGEAIRAALHPAEGTALFFVARGDGSHQFSDTLEEHNAAVRHFQIENRAQQYRSAPVPGG